MKLVKIPVWKKGMSDKETADLAYWERNMLALLIADGWFYHVGGDPYPGGSRVISCKDGKLCFHVPDDFDLGNLRQITANWDGHTTEQKWQRVCKFRQIEYA